MNNEKIGDIIDKFEEEVEDFKIKYPLFVPFFQKIESYNPDQLIPLRHKGHLYAFKKLGTLMYKISRSARNEYCELYDNFIEELWNNKFHIKLDELLKHNIVVLRGYHDMIPIIRKLEKGGYFGNHTRLYVERCNEFLASDTVSRGMIVLNKAHSRQMSPYIYVPSSNVLSIEIPSQKERARYIYNSLTK